MSAKFRVLVTDRAWPDLAIESDILAEVGAVLYEPADRTVAGLAREAVDADAMLCNWAPCAAEVVRAAVKCRHIARTGIGLDNIDVAVATERGIVVTNVPDYCVSEVADHALALLLALARNITFFHLRTKKGEYKLAAAPPMRRLAGRTLGLVGLGRIGLNLVPKARALGLHVIAHTRSGAERGAGCPIIPLDDLLQQSDFVSLHAPLTEQTRNIIGERELGLMKRDAFLINTSRGGLVDPLALDAALRENRIGGAALDVFNPEPPDLSQSLFAHDNLIATPHAAFVSVESLDELRRRSALQIAATLRGDRPEFVVNPTVYAAPQ